MQWNKDVIGQDQAKKVLAEDKDIDGYVSYLVGIWTGAPAVIETLIECGADVALASSKGGVSYSQTSSLAWAMLPTQSPTSCK